MGISAYLFVLRNRFFFPEMAVGSKDVGCLTLPQDHTICGIQENKQSSLVRVLGEAESSRKSQATVRERRFREEFKDIQYLTDDML